MNFIIAFLSTILYAIADVFLKKSMKTNTLNLWNVEFVGQASPVIVFIVFYLISLTGIFDINLDITYKNIIIIILAFIAYTIGCYYRAMIFRDEKISTLLPYENLNKIFTIIIGSSVFRDASLTTFIITLLAIVVIIYFSVDFKNLTFSKNIVKFAFAQLFFSIGDLITGYSIIEIARGGLGMSGFNFIVLYLIIATLVFLFPFFILKWYKEIKTAPKRFYIDRTTAGFTLWFSWFLGMTIISDLGITISVLLSFLEVVTTFLIAFIILKDRPEKKDIILTIIIIGLVSLGYYFK